MRSTPYLCFALTLSFMLPVAAQQVQPVAQNSADALIWVTNQPPARHSLRKLPPNVPPNPPKAENLQLAQQAWRGEYEADLKGNPLLGADGKAIPIVYDRHGKRISTSAKAPATHSINLVEGSLTVDGLTAKVRLDHDIPGPSYIYLSIPDLGTVIVSQAPFVGSAEQSEAFNGSVLTVMAGGHQVQLSSARLLLSKRTSPAWVRTDPGFIADRRNPVMGYGSSLQAPYQWPGAKGLVQEGSKDAPPLPLQLLPAVSSSCGAGSPCPTVGPAVRTQ